MQKKIMWIAGGILLAIAGGVFYLLASSAEKTMMDDMRAQKNENMAAARDAAPQPTVQPVTIEMAPGAYVDYADSIIASTKGTKLLFFHASWCPQCRALEADIRSQGVPSDVTIIKVDFDTSQELRKKYGVTLQTTIVRVDDQGDLVKKFVAYDNPSLQSVKDNLL